MADNNFFIREALNKYSENIFYQSETESFSYHEFRNDIHVMIANLTPFSISTGEKVAIITSNSFQTITLYFALIVLEAIPILVSEKYPKLRLKDLLTSLSCRKIISDDIISSENVHIPDISFPELKLTDIASIMFTSGTSSSPKAVPHTFGNHFYSATGSNRNIKIEPNDKWLLSLPIHHIGGFSILFRTVLAGSSVVFNNTSYELFDYINKMKITHLSLVETQLQKIIVNQQPCPASLKAVLVGGGMVSLSSLNKAIDLGYPIFTTYGMTEMSSQITTSLPGSTIDNLKTSGHLLSYRELKISPDNEILVKGETLCKGYLNADFPTDDNGWFKTSDLGILNDDGSLTVIGRKDNMFISGGENIYPEEIEAYLKEMPMVEDAVVIPARDSRFGQIPVLFYAAHENCDLTVDDISDYLSEKIERFKIPKFLYRFPENYIPLGIKPNRQFLIEYLKDR